MRAPLATRREPAGNQNKATTGAICFFNIKRIDSNPYSTHSHRAILTYQ